MIHLRQTDKSRKVIPQVVPVLFTNLKVARVESRLAEPLVYTFLILLLLFL